MHSHKRVHLFAPASRSQDCYNKNPKHLEDFSHPWLDGETEDQEKDRVELQEVHDLLSLAKVGDTTATGYPFLIFFAQQHRLEKLVVPSLICEITAMFTEHIVAQYNHIKNLKFDFAKQVRKLLKEACRESRAQK